MTKREPTGQIAKCSECGAVVQIRRPSLSGHHFCSRTECKRAKARFYYQKKGAFIKVADEQIRLSFVSAMMTDRVTCQACGLIGAIDGYPHRREDSGPCNALDYGLGRGVLTVDWVDAAMPDRRYDRELVGGTDG